MLATYRRVSPQYAELCAASGAQDRSVMVVHVMRVLVPLDIQCRLLSAYAPTHVSLSVRKYAQIKNVCLSQGGIANC